MTLQMPPSFNTGPSLGSQLGEKLGMGISTGLQGALSTFMEEQKLMKENNALKEAFTSIPQDAPFEEKFKTIMSAHGVSPETKKMALGGLLEYEKHQQQLALDRLKEQRKAAESENQAALTHKIYKEAGYNVPEEHIPGTPKEIYHELAKKKQEGLVPEATKERLGKVFNRQLDITEQGGLGIPYGAAISKLSPKKRELMSEFQTLGVSIEAALMPLVNKGTLAKPRFDYIMSNVPRSDDTPETVRGKLRALSTELGVDIPRLELKEEKKTQKQKPMKKMKAPSGHVQMMNPETGETLFVPSEDVEAAKADNFKVIR